jgi:hypothetical protein
MIVSGVVVTPEGKEVYHARAYRPCGAMVDVTAGAALQFQRISSIVYVRDGQVVDAEVRATDSKEQVAAERHIKYFKAAVSANNPKA